MMDLFWVLFVLNDSYIMKLGVQVETDNNQNPFPLLMNFHRPNATNSSVLFCHGFFST